MNTIQRLLKKATQPIAEKAKNIANPYRNLTHPQYVSDVNYGNPLLTNIWIYKQDATNQINRGSLYIQVRQDSQIQFGRDLVVNSTFADPIIGNQLKNDFNGGRVLDLHPQVAFMMFNEKEQLRNLIINAFGGELNPSYYISEENGALLEKYARISGKIDKYIRDQMIMAYFVLCTRYYIFMLRTNREFVGYASIYYAPNSVKFNYISRFLTNNAKFFNLDTDAYKMVTSVLELPRKHWASTMKNRFRGKPEIAPLELVELFGGNPAAPTMGGRKRKTRRRKNLRR
jgi:hypothetical protein